MSAVLYEKIGSTAWVTLNRPDARNMMNAAMFAGLLDAWDEIRNDRTVRVAILTGAGDVDFCVGGDLRELIPLWTKAKQPETDLERRFADPRILDEVMLKTNPIDKPIQASLFEAVRRWNNSEGLDAFDIELDGSRLTNQQIEEISHSETYKDRLLAFDERR